MANPRHQAEPTPNVSTLGARLTGLARSADDLDCLEVFADLLHHPTQPTWPLLLTVVVEPLGGAEILTAGHVRPGMTLQLDRDLELRVTQLWFEPDDD